MGGWVGAWEDSWVRERVGGRWGVEGLFFWGQGSLLLLRTQVRLVVESRTTCAVSTRCVNHWRHHYSA